MRGRVRVEHPLNVFNFQNWMCPVIVFERNLIPVNENHYTPVCMFHKWEPIHHRDVPFETVEKLYWSAFSRHKTNTTANFLTSSIIAPIQLISFIFIYNPQILIKTLPKFSNDHLQNENTILWAVFSWKIEQLNLQTF